MADLQITIKDRIFKFFTGESPNLPDPLEAAQQDGILLVLALWEDEFEKFAKGKNWMMRAAEFDSLSSIRPALNEYIHPEFPDTKIETTERDDYPNYSIEFSIFLKDKLVGKISAHENKHLLNRFYSPIKAMKDADEAAHRKAHQEHTLEAVEALAVKILERGGRRVV